MSVGFIYSAFYGNLWGVVMKKFNRFFALLLLLGFILNSLSGYFPLSRVNADNPLEDKKAAIISSAEKYIQDKYMVILDDIKNTKQDEAGSDSPESLNFNEITELIYVMDNYTSIEMSSEDRAMLINHALLQENITEFKFDSDKRCIETVADNENIKSVADNIDIRSRIIKATDLKNEIPNLFTSQFKDGGFGINADYTSDILDSILVLDAINSKNDSTYDASSWRLVNYIARQMNSAGSYSYTKISEADSILTAKALYSVSKYMTDNNIKSDLTSDMINKTSAYLKGKLDTSFSKDSIEENLYISLALSESKNLNDPEKIINRLSEIQNEDGSFYDDIYITSLTLWLLAKMNVSHLININDIKMNSTSTVYYSEDSDVKVDYSILYDAEISAVYDVKCTITNGNNVIYESEKIPVSIEKGEKEICGSFEDIVINENKDDGINVKLQLFYGDNLIKETENALELKNRERKILTRIDDLSTELSDYYTFVGISKPLTLTYKLIYTTNADARVKISVSVLKDGNVLEEESYDEILVPEKDVLSKEALTFEPDVTGEAEYEFVVRCIKEGEVLYENTDIFCVVDPTENKDNPKDDSSKDGNDTSEEIATSGDAEEMKIPFTVKWIGPYLSDYVCYAGQEKDISVSLGMYFYGDESFKGTVKTEIIKGEEILDTINTEVETSPEERSYFKNNITNFTVKELGEYVVKVTLYDQEENEIISGTKSVKVIEKEKIDFISNSKVSDDEERTVDISWNDISNSEDKYNYRLYRRYDGTDWESRSIWNEEDKIKVLNVYPEIPLLYDWMNNRLNGEDTPAGLGMFDIESVYIDTFNKAPENYLLENGRWKYDVIYFGAWDGNCSKDLSDKAYEVTQKFVDSGRGVLFGHDTVCLNNKCYNYAKFADQLGIYLKYEPYNINISYIVDVVNYGTLTNFPWTLRGTLYIPHCHSWGQYVGGSLKGTEWMSLDAYKTTDSVTGGHSGFYLVTNKNLGMIQTGHSNGSATDDERKVFANTLFYLHQISQLTTAKDNSFYDLAAPDIPEVTFVERDADSFKVNISSKDNGTRYEYYIEAMTSDEEGEKSEKSNVMTETALSGINGYVFELNDSPDENKDLIKYDSNKENVENAVAADSDGNVSAVIEIPEEAGKYYLHVYAVDNENNISAEKIVPIERGTVSTKISTDKEEYYSDETARIKADTRIMPISTEADVSITLYDSKENYIKEIYYGYAETLDVDSSNEIETDLLLDTYSEGTYRLKIEWFKGDQSLGVAYTDFNVLKKEDGKGTKDEENTPDINDNTEDDPIKKDENKPSINPEDKGAEGDNSKASENSEDASNRSSSPTTGDTINIGLLVILLVISATAIVAILHKKKQRRV